MAEPYIHSFMILLIFFHIGFFIAIKTKRNDIIDITWGLGFVLLSVVAFVKEANFLTLTALVLVSIWGFRLSWHLGKRVLKKKEEDYRYKNWRQGWSRHWVINSYVKIFLFQTLLLFMVALPIINLPNINNYSFSLVNLLGIAVWLFGFLFEAIADKQLKKFVSQKKNKGKIIQSGLWQYSRHPNYFGEVTLWWGFWLFTWSPNINHLTLIGPFTITFLILFVSGIPLLEKKYQDNPEFQDYKKRTSAFFPWPPKKL